MAAISPGPASAPIVPGCQHAMLMLPSVGRSMPKTSDRAESAELILSQAGWPTYGPVGPGPRPRQYAFAPAPASWICAVTMYFPSGREVVLTTVAVSGEVPVIGTVVVQLAS